MTDLRVKLRPIIEDNTIKTGRIFDYCIQALIILSLIAYTIETLPGISEPWLRILHVFEVVCIIIFTVEYILRIFVAKKPFKYIFSFYGIIDFLAIFPFYISSIVDLRAVRVFRIFRVFRALKLVRYSRALNRFHRAAKLVREELVLFLLVTAIFIFLSSAGIYYFEHEAQPDEFHSVLHSFWWAVVTLTTVGYGDVYPITVGGKIFTLFILFVGVGIVTIPAGIVASALSKARALENEEGQE